MHEITVKRKGLNPSIYKNVIEYHVGLNYIRLRRERNPEVERWIPLANLLWFDIVEVVESENLTAET